MNDYRSDKTSGYHVLLEPRSEVRLLLSGVVEALAAEYGGPVFTPHVTLLAQIPVESEEVLKDRVRKLASTLAPFRLELNGFGAEEKYFRSLYMLTQESTDLEVCHAAGLEQFEMTDTSEYMPHLSLLYGNYEQDSKNKSIVSLQELVGTSFVVDTLFLYRTLGEVSTWECIGEYPFGA